MGKQIKLSNIDFAKVGNTLAEASKVGGGKYFRDHTPEFLAGALSVITIDNIRVRLGRKKDQRVFEENALKQQQIIRKHESEINVLKDEAEQAQEAVQKVDQLAQIVNNITGGGVSE